MRVQSSEVNDEEYQLLLVISVKILRKRFSKILNYYKENYNFNEKSDQILIFPFDCQFFEESTRLR
jgi:hypothetical protein